MTMDFSKLSAPASTKRPIAPIEIFEKLPNLPGTPNDIWRGQTQALTEWHEHRKVTDVLISLNTGAGKTLVGLLVAQSLVNEGIENVVYVCATIDLVNQTAREATKIGLPCTTRTVGDFDNDLFASGRAFCITTYHAIFNGLSSIRRRFFPGAIIFDDAHVAESILRQSLTMRIESRKDPDLFRELANLIEPYFAELHRRSEFRDSLDGNHPTIAFGLPGAIRSKENQIQALFDKFAVDNDYGAFLLEGRELNSWLSNERNLALLPELLQKQLLLGRSVQEQMQITSDSKVIEIIGTILGRNQSWLDYYGENVNNGSLDQEKVERTEAVERRLTEAALAEAKFASHLWDGDYAAARNALENSIEETARADTSLAGWHNVWIGVCYEAEGDQESAYLAYQQAKHRLSRNLSLPSKPVELAKSAEEITNAFANAVYRVVGVASNDVYRRELRALQSRLADLDGSTPRRMEESVRALGESLGFEATRPDNDGDTGPDVLWVDRPTKSCLAFELKTDKGAAALYSKRDISQGHDHLSWVKAKLLDCECLGLLYVGPTGRCDGAANPSATMWLTESTRLSKLRDQVIALMEDQRPLLPIERLAKTKEVCSRAQWTLHALVDELKIAQMESLK